MSRDVESALADCLVRLESGEASLEDALGTYPELMSELEPLLAMAMELRSMPKLSAPDALRGARRPVFASPAPASRRVLPWGWRALRPTPIWTAPAARLAAGFALVAMLSGGTMVASAGSLPEEPLYPVKLAVENVQIALTPDPQQRAELELRFAGRRLEEVETAVQQGKLQAVQQGLTLYEQRVQGAVDQAQAAGPAPQQEAQIQDSLERQQEVLARVYDQVPATAQEAILHAMEVSHQGGTQGEKKSGGEGEKAKGNPKAPAIVPASPTPTGVTPSDPSGKGHESPGKAGLLPTPVGTSEPVASAARENRGNGRGGDGAPGREKDAQGMSTGNSEPTVEGSSRPVLPTSQPWRGGPQDSDWGSPTPTAGIRSATPSPIPSAGSVPLPTQTVEPERNRQDGGRGGRDDSSTQPSNPASGNGTSSDKGKNGRERDSSSRGGSR